MAKSVLIVDDNEHLRRILATFLQSRGYEISEAASGHEAIATAIAMKPNLILLDLTLHVPIIGCSAYFGSELRQEALRAGMADYLQKPISAAEIESIVEQLILSER